MLVCCWAQHVEEWAELHIPTGAASDRQAQQQAQGQGQQHARHTGSICGQPGHNACTHASMQQQQQRTQQCMQQRKQQCTQQCMQQCTQQCMQQCVQQCTWQRMQQFCTDDALTSTLASASWHPLVLSRASCVLQLDGVVAEALVSTGLASPIFQVGEALATLPPLVIYIVHYSVHLPFMLTVLRC
eukprot:187472-Pelagomonas_calceolata.AAC.1